MLGGADLFFRWKARSSAAPTYAENYWGTIGPMGRGTPPPGDYPSSSKTVDGDTLYDVVYTIDRNGFRETRGGGDGADTYLFFGGSFTFGEGLENSETYPQRFSEALDFRFTVVNAGFHGFGAQQMLRGLEVGLVDESITGPVRYVVYLAIDDHPDRAVGYPYWTLRSPRYVLDEGGEPTFVGLYDEFWPARLHALLGYLGGLPERVAAAAHALGSEASRNELWAAIVERSARIAQREHHARFVCVFWDLRDGARIDRLEALLEQRGLKTLRVSPFLADLEEDEINIRPALERHPSARATEALGFALARHLTEAGSLAD